MAVKSKIKFMWELEFNGFGMKCILAFLDWIGR